MKLMFCLYFKTQRKIENILFLIKIMLVCSLSCFTTEILEGFDVQRTSGFADTIRKYGYLTQSITQYYSTHLSYGSRRSRVCPSFDEFVKKCQDLEKMTVSDVFALQLMQVTLPT